MNGTTTLQWCSHFHSPDACSSSSRKHSVVTFASRRRRATEGPHDLHHNIARVKKLLHHLHSHPSTQLDRETCASLLKACSACNMYEEGKLIHSHIIDRGMAKDTFLMNHLLNMYAKCGHLQDAIMVLHEIQHPNVVSWTSIIAAHAQQGHTEAAFRLFWDMQKTGILPNRVTFVSIFSACSSPTALTEGKRIHAYATHKGFEKDIAVGNAILTMYGKCGDLQNACKMFDKMPRRNVISWSAMIAAYVQRHQWQHGIHLFWEMQREGILPNRITFLTILDACTHPSALIEGKFLHACVINSGFESDTLVGTAVVDMYGKCGSPKDAHRVFNRMPERDVVSWNALILAYAQHGQGRIALELFQGMMAAGIKPSSITFINALYACGRVSALEQGKMIHACAIKSGFGLDDAVGTAVVNMYGKCGSLEDACTVFNMMPKQTSFVWNTMMTAYAQHGCGEEAVQLFQKMQLDGVAPDGITFVNLLSACSRSGLIDEGLSYFFSMNERYGITPTVEHYGCLIDLLGRAGRVDQAEEIIDKMPCPPDAVAWRSFLGACKVNRDVERAKRAAENLLKLDLKDSAAYVELSNIYAVAGRWDDAAKVRKMMEENGIRKEQGISLVEVDNVVHEFVARDGTYPQTDEIMQN